MLKSRSASCILLLGLPLVALADGPAGVFKMDPVALIGGQELAGIETIAADHFRFRYWFANEANRVEFLKHPEKYEIQMGGACARMGPLSGLGRTDIFAVHGGRLYLFASEACRRTFLAAPEKMLDPDDPVISGGDHSDRNARKANALLIKVLMSMGGADRVDAVTSYEQGGVRHEKYNGERVEVVEALSLSFPGQVRTDYSWNGKKHAYFGDGETGGYQSDSEGSWPLHAQQVRFLAKHHYWRNPLAILRARKQPGFVAIREGTALLPYDGSQVPIERVTVSCSGATATLGIESRSGRILSMTYRGQGPELMFGTVEKRFTDFKAIDGITLPTTVQTFFEGTEVPNAEMKNMQVKLNVTFPPDHFQHSE